MFCDTAWGGTVGHVCELGETALGSGVVIVVEACCWLLVLVESVIGVMMSGMLLAPMVEG